MLGRTDNCAQLLNKDMRGYQSTKSIQGMNGAATEPFEHRVRLLVAGNHFLGGKLVGNRDDETCTHRHMC